jgi:ribonuclease BN (tRNA processing enzyme)
MRSRIAHYRRDPAVLGRIATDAGVKQLLLNHFVPADASVMNEQKWADAVRTTFKGDLVVAHDLMEIPL